MQRITNSNATEKRDVDESQRKVIRLAVLFTHPIQYFSPVLNRLSDHPEVDLTVYYCSKQGVEGYYDDGFGREVLWNIPLLDGYNFKFLKNIRGDVGVGGFFSLFNPSIIRELRKERYDAIIVHGYDHLTKWLAFGGARLSHTAVVHHGDSNLLEPRPFYIRAVKWIVIGPLMRSMKACLYIGRNNYDFYRHYRVKDTRLFLTPYSVDNDKFSRLADELREKKEELKREIGIPEELPVILFVGKLIPKKQPMILLKAFSSIRRDILCALVLVGDGILRTELESYCIENDIQDVFFTGFINQREIACYYAIGDILVLPSKCERWGLVVNEAMNFGMPIVVSDRVGCAADLVIDGSNGFIVGHDAPNNLEERLRELIQDMEKAKSFGQKSREIIQHWSYEACVNGIVEACQSILKE